MIRTAPARLCVLAALLLCLPKTLWGRGEEHFGNAPLNERNYSDWPGIMPVVNDASRVYHTVVNGNEHFYFTGDTAALNEALRNFARIVADRREVVLRPGTGLAPTFTPEKTVPFNWNLHIEGGISSHLMTLDKEENVWSKWPVFSVYVGRDIKLDQIKMPEGVTAIAVTELARWCREGLISTDKTVRGWGAGELARLDPFDAESLGAIVKLLKDEDSWVRLNAAGAISIFGRKAEPAIPALEEAAKTADANLKQRIEKTIEAVRQAKDNGATEREYRAGIEAIQEFCMSLGK